LEGLKELGFFLVFSPSDSTTFVNCSIEAFSVAVVVWAFHSSSYTL
jgi:hypothetical protein